jgi:general secretion pathway protein L
VPPLSAARLKAALPNLVEDQLVSDPAECVMVAGGLSERLRTVAVVQRAWLEALVNAFIGFGARHITALPAQLCLPYQSETIAAAISEQDGDIDLTLRLAEQDGIGLPIMPEQQETAAREVVEALLAMAPPRTAIILYVPQIAVRTYQAAATASSPDDRISVFADNWSRWIAGANSASLDLMAGLGTHAGSRLNWRPWRWPLALASALLLVNMIALNLDWWRMKSEAELLRADMTRIYRSAFPKEQVIVDPVAQMKQKIAAGNRGSGQAAPDDFTALASAFGEAWTTVTQTRQSGNPPAIAGLEYRERSLFVQLKPGGDVPTDRIKSVLAGRDLSVALAPSQSAGVVLQIRSAK